MFIIFATAASTLAGEQTEHLQGADDAAAADELPWDDSICLVCNAASTFLRFSNAIASCSAIQWAADALLSAEQDDSGSPLRCFFLGGSGDAEGRAGGEGAAAALRLR